MNNQIFAAPLAGITDKPFRQLIRTFAPDVSLVTEMISCHSLVQQHKNCIRNFDTYFDEGNVGAQIFGADINLMAEAAKILQDNGAKWIDINMGCPVPKVATRACAGAFLMKNHELAGKLIEAVVKAVQIPVSVKTRLGWDAEHINWIDLAHIAEDNGAKWLCLHGRTRAQGYAGSAIFIEKPDIKLKIIANGDIKNITDIHHIETLGYDGVMIGRSLLGRPWLLGLLTNNIQSVPNIGNVVLEHLNLMVNYYGERVAIPMFRKHVAWYSTGMENSGQFRIKINQINDYSELKNAIYEFWCCNN